MQQVHLRPESPAVSIFGPFSLNHSKASGLVRSSSRKYSSSVAILAAHLRFHGSSSNVMTPYLSFFLPAVIFFVFHPFFRLTVRLTIFLTVFLTILGSKSSGGLATMCPTMEVQMLKGSSSSTSTSVSTSVSTSSSEDDTTTSGSGDLAGAGVSGTERTVSSTPPFFSSLSSSSPSSLPFLAPPSPSSPPPPSPLSMESNASLWMVVLAAPASPSPPPDSMASKASLGPSSSPFSTSLTAAFVLRDDGLSWAPSLFLTSHLLHGDVEHTSATIGHPLTILGFFHG